MARPNLQYEPNQANPGPGEWQELRSELVALLDQVETQVARTAPRQQAYGGLSERMRDLRHQVAEIEPETRHREALRSVQRAIDRFSDRDGPLPPNPRDTLADAIEQIRARHVNAPARQRGGAALDELAGAVSGISERLERLEGELRALATSQTTNVKEIAEQVGQLSHVVELLAGAVGETGQVKRLEAQLAGLARLITREQNVDFSALTTRIDDVTATVGRLADLQAEFAGRSLSGADSMLGVENGVRTIYDRLDAIEKAMAVPQVELEKFTEQLQQFTSAMKAPQPQGLIELIDALNVRISDMEGQGPQVGMLKADVEALREAVIDSMEPRFAALELQIEALADKVGEPNVGQIEAQVRQLASRMDQTGAQLSNIARMYDQPIDREGDLDALAEMVAKRTTAAVAEMDQGQALGAAAFDEIEKRVSRVVQAAATTETHDDSAALSATIREVSERLAKLEASLTGQRAASDEEKAPIAGTITDAETMFGVPDDVVMVDFVEDEIEANADADAPGEFIQASAPPADDEMPFAPGDDAPLLGRPFGDPSPLEAALEVKNGPRLHHGGVTEMPRAVELPPAPIPTLDMGFDPEPLPDFPAAFEAESVVEVEPVSQVVAVAEVEVDRVTTPNRNTFIEAHRRAARMAATGKVAAPAPAPTDTAGSLMGRAFNRFQAALATQSNPDAVEPAPVEKAPKVKLFRKKERKLAGDKDIPAPKVEPAAPEEVAVVPEVEPVIIPQAPASEPTEPATAEVRPSFLLRHRQPILLAAAVVALSCLAINVVSQRMNEGAGPVAEPAAPQKVGDAALVPTPLAEQKLDVVAPKSDARIIPMVDTIHTASIDPAAAQGFAPVGKLELPQGFAPANPATAAIAASLDQPLPETLASPVKVEMPPANVGPLSLLKAAADGDARAQFEVAAIYTEGRAVPEDLKAAAIWYERAAVQGFAPAQYRLGSLLENGRGVEKDLDEARLWYQRSAEAGNRMAMHNLAALYAAGGLGTQQFDAAARWFEQAAERGMTDSQFNLGMLYARGLGVKQDLSASYKWFALAAARGDADAAKARDGIAASLDTASVQRLGDEVAAWKPQAIDLVANFAPIGTWEKNFDPGQAIASVDVVKGVQKALVLLGFDVGSPDGLAGPKTAVAIRSFERATGMNESGAINPRLLAVLGSQPV